MKAEHSMYETGYENVFKDKRKNPKTDISHKNRPWKFLEQIKNRNLENLTFLRYILCKTLIIKKKEF